jgi:pimeloyl-ACP methyl ester carboxylesterase
MSRRTVLVHAGVMDPGMWDGFELPGDVVRHHLEQKLADTVGGEPAALVGASYGGLVCLSFAARHPDLVTALVLLDAPLPDHEESGDLLAYAEEEERLVEEGRLEEATDLNLAHWEIGEEHRAAVRKSLEYDVEEVESVDLAAVIAPALVLVGERDKPDFRAMSERMARELPNAELAVIEGAAHLPSIDAPEATLARVKPFLDRNHKL